MIKRWSFVLAGARLWTKPGFLRQTFVEVLSPSTEANDHGVKLLDYAAHGVQEYWIVDPDKEIVEQYVLEGDTYDLRMKSKTGMLQSLAAPGFEMSVRAIFEGLEKQANN